MFTYAPANGALGNREMNNAEQSVLGGGINESGAPEFYDYSALGNDPLRDLIERELGLEIKHIAGGACVLDGHILQSIDALGGRFGVKTRDVAHAFRQRCAQLLSPGAF